MVLPRIYTEGDDQADDADGDGSDTMPCPACGSAIYDDSPQCPFCGEYVVMRSGGAARRVGWWVALVLALVAMGAFVLTR